MVLTALAIYFQEPLTHETLACGPQDLGTAFYSYGYHDHYDGGHSQVTVDQHHPLAFTCEIRPGFTYPYCGVGLTFDTHQAQKGIDLSKFDKVSLTVRYRGA